MGRAEHVARGRREVHTGFWWRNLREGEHLEDLGLYGRIILKCMFVKWDRNMHWIDLPWDRYSGRLL
jgi:hypothetical protein